jgi:hypothetical protein
MFYATGPIFDGAEAPGPVFMFCAPRLIFGSTKGVWSCFQVLRSRILFRRYRGCLVLFLCFTLLDSFSTVPRASGLIFLLCAPKPVLGGTEGIGSSFHVLHSRTHFRRYRGHRVQCSCFALPDSFSAVPSAAGPVFMFCASELILGGTEGVGSHLHVLRSRTHSGRFRGRRISFSSFTHPDTFSVVRRAPGPVFSCFALADLFWTVSRASGLVFMFCAIRLVFDGAEGVGSRFHVLRSQTHFRQYRGRRVMFSSSTIPDTFSVVPRASGPV